MMQLRKISATTLVAVILILGTVLRFYIYGDLRLSVGNNDTASYIRSAAAPLFSWKMLAGERLLTTNLLYKAASDPVKCPLTVLSLPGDAKKVNRQIQPCFAYITVLQNLLAALAWCTLAWTISRRIENRFLKIMGGSLILAFGFSPQIAEWDFVLSPESLTLSLFVISLALALEFGLQIANHRSRAAQKRVSILVITWMVVLITWMFVRDVHLYAVLVTILLTLPLFFFNEFRKSKLILIPVVVLAGVCWLGIRSAQDSLRATHYPLQHAFEGYIFPFPSRMEFMQKFGMPDPKSAEFQSWFDANATSKYGLFLLTHPDFVLTTIQQGSFYFARSSEQFYFKPSNVHARDLLLTMGGFLHPESNLIYLIDLLILLGLGIVYIRSKTAADLAWLWIGLWFISCALVTLLPAFFGDTLGTPRHILPSIEMFRLFFWTMGLQLLDRAASIFSKQRNANVQRRELLRAS